MRSARIGAVMGAVFLSGMGLVGTPARADGLSVCATVQEAAAFGLRRLQSRLMVAGLACNQREAYNRFVETFRPPLVAAGADLIAYFQRSGGGQAALNRHVTDLANFAGLRRAENPEAFCAETWAVFLDLEAKPDELTRQASTHMLTDSGSPEPCPSPTTLAATTPPAESGN